MVFRHKINLLQRLFLRKSICIIFFVCLFSVMLVSANNDEINSHAKDEIIEKLKTDVEFKNFVEKIYDLIVNQHSTDDIIKIIGDPLKNSYDIQKLVTDIRDLLNHQNSKNNIISIIENNKKIGEYATNKIVKTIYFILLETVILVSAFIGVKYLRNRSSKKKNNGSSNQMDEQINDYMVNVFDDYLFDLVKEQVEILKHENFITEQDCKSLFVCKNKESKFYNMTLKEQIAYARKMGLIEKSSSLGDLEKKLD
jgi:hypothetical protein